MSRWLGLVSALAFVVAPAALAGAITGTGQADRGLRRVARRLLIGTLSVTIDNRGIQVSRSPDGVQWSPLTTVVADTASSGAYDKE